MDVNYIFILSLIIIIIGYVIKKLDIITEENGKVIAKIIFNLTLPAVILKVASTIELNIALILLPLISLIFSLFVAVIGLIIFRNYPPKTKGMILMTIIGFNIGNFAFPLVEGLWGQEGLNTLRLLIWAMLLLYLSFAISLVLFIHLKLIVKIKKSISNILVDVY